MSGIWWGPEYARLATFSATVKGAKARLKIELEIDEPGMLGALLSDLARIEREQQSADAPPAKKPRRQKSRQIEHRPQLALPDYSQE